MKHFVATCMIALPAFGMAAGTITPEPPKPTENTLVCTEGLVWDIAVESCVAPIDLSTEGKEHLDSLESSNLRDDILLRAVREFAYADQIDHAQSALRAVTNQDHDLAMTYWGFTERKLGHMDSAFSHYERAILLNPDNLLARSYMGQGYVELGKTKLAQLQLDEINTRGGVGTWPAISLKNAIQNGKGYGY